MFKHTNSADFSAPWLFQKSPHSYELIYAVIADEGIHLTSGSFELSTADDIEVKHVNAEVDVDADDEEEQHREEQSVIALKEEILTTITKARRALFVCSPDGSVILQVFCEISDYVFRR